MINLTPRLRQAAGYHGVGTTNRGPEAKEKEEKEGLNWQFEGLPSQDPRLPNQPAQWPNRPPRQETRAV